MRTTNNQIIIKGNKFAEKKMSTLNFALFFVFLLIQFESKAADKIFEFFQSYTFYLTKNKESKETPVLVSS